MRTLFLFLLAGSNLFAAKSEVMPDYSVTYKKSSYPSSKGVRIFISCEFDSDYNPHRELHFGLNEDDDTIMKLDTKNQCELFRKPQKAVLRFYYDAHFQEIETDSIELKIGYTTVISLRFKAQNEPRPVKKPVIYVYPESEIELAVQLKTTGKLTFSYPEYSNGWKGTAHMDGSMEINGKNYPYLFWESEQQFNTFDFELGGFLLKRETIMESLEKHLSDIGFNDREKTDFITFWGPQLQQHERVYMQFILNEQCDQFATLTIEPRPQHLNRVYMIWAPADPSRNEVLKTQKLKTINREGFDVLEWGGVEISRFTNFD